jgi:hypothetical protein
MKKPKAVPPSEPPFALREQLRRRAVAERVQLPAEPPTDLEDRRAQPPKRGGYP